MARTVDDLRAMSKEDLHTWAVEMQARIAQVRMDLLGYEMDVKPGVGRAFENQQTMQELQAFFDGAARDLSMMETTRMESVRIQEHGKESEGTGHEQQI